MNKLQPFTLWMLSLLISSVLLACTASDTESQTEHQETPGQLLRVTERGPPMSVARQAPQWVIDHYVDRINGASIAVHKVVVNDDIVTLLFSIELDHIIFDQSHFIVPNATLVSDADDTLKPLFYKILYDDIDVALSAITFQLPSDVSRHYSLFVDDLTFTHYADGETENLFGPWHIPIIRLNDYRVSGRIIVENGHQFWEGRPTSDRGDVGVRIGGPQGYSQGFSGDSPIGWIVTSAFDFLDRHVYFLVKPDGDVIEITESRYYHIDELFETLEPTH